MSVNNEYPVLDGIAPSWADISCKATPDGGSLIVMADIKSITTGSVVEVGEQRGASGGRVIKRTTGAKKDTAGMVLYHTGYLKLMRNLAKLAPSRGNEKLVSLVHFGFQIQFTPPGDPDVYEYRLFGVRFLGRNTNNQEGTDPNEVDCVLSIAKLADIVDGQEIVMI